MIFLAELAFKSDRLLESKFFHIGSDTNVSVPSARVKGFVPHRTCEQDIYGTPARLILHTVEVAPPTFQGLFSGAYIPSDTPGGFLQCPTGSMPDRNFLVADLFFFHFFRFSRCQYFLQASPNIKTILKRCPQVLFLNLSCPCDFFCSFISLLHQHLPFHPT